MLSWVDKVIFKLNMLQLKANVPIYQIWRERGGLTFKKGIPKFSNPSQLGQFACDRPRFLDSLYEIMHFF